MANVSELDRHRGYIDMGHVEEHDAGMRLHIQCRSNTILSDDGHAT